MKRNMSGGLKLSSVSVLIPAAGASRRLGQPKQLVLYKGKSLIQRAIERAAALAPHEIIVVTGADANSVLQAARETSAHCVYNPDWASGMGGSIAVGASTTDKVSNGLLILLCDQWNIRAGDLQRLARTWLSDPSQIVCALTAGHFGPPVIFPSSCFASLRSLQGDQGARSILDTNADLLTGVPMNNAAADLDTPSQLDALNKQ